MAGPKKERVFSASIEKKIYDKEGKLDLVKLQRNFRLSTVSVGHDNQMVSLHFWLKPQARKVSKTEKKLVKKIDPMQMA